jgi:hypothetical protein
MSDEKFRKPGDAATRLKELREGSKPLEPADEAGLVGAEESEQEAFSTVSADRQQKIMLVLWFIKGYAKAKAYSYLTDIDFDPSSGIVLTFVDSEVKITGRNLQPLFLALSAQRVQSIQEMDDLHAEATVEAKGTVVTQILVQERKAEDTP